MSIIRIQHNKENPYVMLSKSSLEDTKLSWAAKGLWSYLLSKPDNWEVNINHLVKNFGNHNEKGRAKKGHGRDAVYGLLNELRDQGYAQLVQKREKGQFIKPYWIIFEFQVEMKISPLPYKSIPVIPNPVQPDTK